MTQPDQKPPQSSDMSAMERLIEKHENPEIGTHLALCDAARAELSAMRDELERWKTEAENLLWNLAGCDTYAMGYGLDGDHDKSAARPALESCRKMALHNVELRTQLAAQSARMVTLENAWKREQEICQKAENETVEANKRIVALEADLFAARQAVLTEGLRVQVLEEDRRFIADLADRQCEYEVERGAVWAQCACAPCKAREHIQTVMVDAAAKQSAIDAALSQSADTTKI